ncbi:hypothetical protein GCM10025876_27320 [Demequina litorisediminis]|uniref:Uncharacterized protein n=1 Tax=Demequina litorisediminis TaxID=1849022 RepID=A0ABQ6IIH8_9MICO|nr:hypothetical protein GCM10025876_27320 [Demequina litorisediminis]
MVAAVDEALDVERHVVPQVVEAELVVGAIRDVGGVLLAALLGRHAGEDAARLHAEEAEHAAHEVGLVRREVVVHGDDVDAFTGQRVEVRGEGRDERLTFTGLHLGDVAAVKGGATHDLDVEVTQAERATRGLADGRKRLGEHRVEALTVGVALLELVGERTDFGVGELFVDALHGVRQGDHLLQAAQRPALAHADDAIKYGHSHYS